MKIAKIILLSAALLCAPLARAADENSSMDQLGEKLNPEKIFKGKISEADIDTLADAMKSALAGKKPVLPDDFKLRIKAMAESMRTEMTPIMSQLIDEMAKTIKQEMKGEKI